MNVALLHKRLVSLRQKQPQNCGFQFEILDSIVHIRVSGITDVGLKPSFNFYVDFADCQKLNRVIFFIEKYFGVFEDFV